MLQADAAFVQADRASLENLLDEDFTFTASDGKTLTKSEFLRNPPQPPSTSAPKAFVYGQLGDVQSTLGRLHILRVWVNRPEGWKTIVYQEVLSLPAPPKVTPSAAKDCQNPCKNVPYVPKNDAEMQVLTAYSRLETAAMARNSTVFATLVADEFIAASSASSRTFTKQQRIQGFEQGRMGGLAPTPLVSAQFFDFPGAVLMRSEHRPEHGNPLHVTRIWIKRGGRWMETLSYQTAVEAR